MEISSLTDGTRIKLRIIDIQGGHYGIVLETLKRHNVLYLGEARGNKLGVIFLEDKKENFAPSKSSGKFTKTIVTSRRIS